jgi:squalene synthase HpnC
MRSVSDREPLARAYAVCERLAFSHYENFPVASWILPASMRPHVAAVYAFARIADDMADEGDHPPAVRQAQLDSWREKLHERVADGGVDAQRPERDRDAMIIDALSHSIRSLALPISLFDDLVSAFRQDTTTTRYDSWADLLDYCRRSADPVGRLVLRISGVRDSFLDQSSDALCTALQLTNFWQDFGIDWRRGRLYVPRQVLDSCGAVELDLADGRLSPAWARAIEACCGVTREKFSAGRAICDSVAGRLKYELRLTWLGGRRVLDRVERSAAGLLTTRPRLGARDVPALAWQAAVWRRAA